jgi:dipeptidyl-peptidase-4
MLQKNIRYLCINTQDQVQQVANQWNSANDYWFMMLTQQGYIVACVDGRGTGFKGADFKKVTQLELGKYSGGSNRCCKVIGNYAFVDKTRIGIFGWSLGFMVSNSLSKAMILLNGYCCGAGNELEVL